MKMDDLVKSYIQTREKKAQLKAAYDASVAQYDALQDKIEALLLVKFKELGVDSVKTDKGTAYTSSRTSATIADWDMYKAFCMAQPEPLEYIERRPSKAAVEQFKSEHSDLPPGINYTETKTVNFRRS
jgi:hypothetical protein